MKPVRAVFSRLSGALARHFGRALGTVCALAVAISGTVTFAAFNMYAEKIVDFNAEVRLLVTGRPASKQIFSSEGVPYSYSPRLEDRFVSPFYVVHYGLIHSETCRTSVDARPYHWIEDSTAVYWPQPPEVSLEKFENLSRWVVENIEVGRSGKAHLLYHFDWPYEGYPNDVLRAPWWSGLTDGYAIVLMLRAYDCFGDPTYLEAAGDLYRSVVAPVEEGGSLLALNGHPWIEEYVDPTAPVSGMSRVFNGMVYGYFGVKSYEEYAGREVYSGPILSSIVENADVFALGPWSYYDAIGGEANIKYHNVNLALIEDQRIYRTELAGLVEDWRQGRRAPGVHFAIYGPNSPAKYHFILTWIAVWAVMFAAAMVVAYLTAPLFERAGRRGRGAE